MNTLVLANQKGGVGKTTLCIHLAVQASLCGERVVLLDTDPQGSLAEWFNSRSEPKGLAFAEANLSHLREQLVALSNEGYTLAIIDTPPSVTPAVAGVIASSTLVVIPTKTGTFDLRALGSTLDMCEASGKRQVFVINDVIPRLRSTAEAAIALSQHGVVAPEVTHRRNDYMTALSDGRVAQELDSESTSASEIAKLWDYINGQAAKASRSQE